MSDYDPDQATARAVLCRFLCACQDRGEPGERFVRMEAGATVVH